MEWPAFNPAGRADIVDRNGVLLASNLPTHTLYVEPSKIFDREEALAALGRVFPDLDLERAGPLSSRPAERPRCCGTT